MPQLEPCLPQPLPRQAEKPMVRPLAQCADCETFPESPKETQSSAGPTCCKPSGVTLGSWDGRLSPSVFSSTVLCFTKATSPAPSARHLCRINREPGRDVTPCYRHSVPTCPLLQPFSPCLLSWGFVQSCRGLP